MDSSIQSTLSMPMADLLRLFWSQRSRALIAGTVLLIAGLVAANLTIVLQLHRDALEAVQVSLLRQSMTLSELIQTTLQSVDLALTNVAEKIRTDEIAGEAFRKHSDHAFYDFLRLKIYPRSTRLV